jgi:hypothetical protein
MKPMLFSSPLVRALHNSSIGSWPVVPIDSALPFKSQTRRPAKPQPEPNSVFGVERLVSKSPYRAGDIVYVRETHRLRIEDGVVEYKAGGCIEIPDEHFAGITDNGTFRPSIHMPKWASRIHLEIMRVRVERACDISEEDARAEGTRPQTWGGQKPMENFSTWEAGTIAPGAPGFYCHKHAFRRLWQSIYGPDAWEKWVWVYDLKRIK